MKIFAIATHQRNKNVNRLSLKDHKEFTELLIDIRMKHQLFKESFTRVFFLGISTQFPAIISKMVLQHAYGISYHVPIVNQRSRH